MRTNYYIPVLSLTLGLLVSVFAFTACGSDDDDDNGSPSNPLVGTWYVKFIEKDKYHSCEELTFNADFTCLWEAYNEDDGRRFVESKTGTYKVDGNTLTIIYRDSEPWIQTFSINGNQLIIGKHTWTKK